MTASSTNSINLPILSHLVTPHCHGNRQRQQLGRAAPSFKSSGHQMHRFETITGLLLCNSLQTGLVLPWRVQVLWSGVLQGPPVALRETRLNLSEMINARVLSSIFPFTESVYQRPRQTRPLRATFVGTLALDDPSHLGQKYLPSLYQDRYALSFHTNSAHTES